jgi:hypothetical protein
LHRHDRAAVGLDALQRVPADRIREVGRVEVDHVVDAVAWCGISDRHRLVAMRIDKGKAAARGEVGAHQVVQQRRFSGAGAADDFDVPAALLRRQNHLRVIAPGVRANS